jgi:hypothetical protein
MPSTPRTGIHWLIALIFIAAVPFAVAQDAADAPAEQQAATTEETTPPETDADAQADAEADPDAEAAEDVEPLSARVLEVNGSVKYSGLEGETWQDVTADLELPPQTQIRTGIRSSVKLQIGAEEPYTAMVIDSAGQVILAEAYKTQQRKTVRVGVSYGQIRAGVAEGGLESDFTVDSPVATLSKRGTWDFGLAYTRGTDRFEIFLLDRGLVDALNKITQQRRTLNPGQAVTQAMRLWLDEAQIRRNVSIVDILGQENISVAFNELRNSGLGVVNPGGGYQPILNLSNRRAADSFANQAREALRGTPFVPLNLGNNARPEGFFGTGRGDQLIEVIVEKNTNLSQRTLTFRRAALENWLKNRNR